MNRANQPPSVIILGAGFETGNMGVSALANGAISAVLASFPNASITLFDYGKESKIYKLSFNGVETEVSLRNVRFSKNCFLYNHIIKLCLKALFARILPARLAHTFLRSDPYLKAIQEAVAIGALSGGDSFSDIYGLTRLLYVSLPQVLVLILQRPLVLLPQTYGPFRSMPGRIMARWILRRATQIYSRDKEGIGIVKALAVKTLAEPRSTFDVAFAMESRPVPLGAFLPPPGAIGLNVSGLLYASNWSARDRTVNSDSYRQILHELIYLFATTLNQSIVLVPHVLGSSSESDLAAAIDFHDSLPADLQARVRVLDVPADASQIKYLIGRCEFFVGSRMHACIAALSLGIPAIGLAYSSKFIGVYDSIGVGDLVVDLRDAAKGETVDRAKNLWLRRNQFAAQLCDQIPAIRAQSALLFRDLMAPKSVDDF